MGLKSRGTLPLVNCPFICFPALLLHLDIIQSCTIMVVGDISLKGKIAVVTGGGSGMFFLAIEPLQH